MASRIAAIADAVKTALNAAPEGTFSQEFTAERVYRAFKDLESLATLRVMVVPKARDIELLDRSHKQSDVQIDVGIMKRVSETCDPTTESGNTELDPLLFFSEQVAEFFGPGAYGEARWKGGIQPLLFDPDSLKDRKTFLTVITLTFKLY